MITIHLNKKMAVLISILSFFIFMDLSSQEKSNLNDDMILPYLDVSESVVMLQSDKEHGANITCFAIDEGLIFVDCSFFTEIAVRFRRDMEERFQKKTLALLLTHAHTDHFFGMGAFEDVPVYATEAEKPLFQHQMSIDFQSRVEGYKRIFPAFDQALKTATLFMPTQWFDEEIELGSGNSKVIIRSTGGHTAGSSYALLEKEGVLACGDIIQVDFFPYFGDQTGNMTVWIETLKNWENMNINYICPGHGRFVNKAYLSDVRQYFEDLVAVLTRLKKDGLAVRDAVFHPDLPKGYWPEDSEKPGWFDPAVATLYRSIEVEKPETARELKLETGSVTDIDGNVYQTVKIGDQWWMAENLHVTHDPSGNIIKSFIFNNDPANESLYGRLYSWDVAMNGSTLEKARGIAPEGWHIPDDEDWKKLFDILGGALEAGGKMKEKGTGHWLSPNKGATNVSGFTGLPAGGYSMGMFEGLGVGTHFWSSSSNGTQTTVPSLHTESEEVLLFDVPKTFHHSVRCVKD